MTRQQAEIVYGALLGVVIGPCYTIAKAAWAGDVSTALNSGLLTSAVIGAIAGAFAFAVRQWAR